MSPLLLGAGANVHRSRGLAALFSDDFNDNSLDAAKWTTIINTATDLAEVNQRLEWQTAAGNWSDPSIESDDLGRVDGYALDFDVYFVSIADQMLAIGFWDGTGLDPASDFNHLLWFYSGGNVYARTVGEADGPHDTYAAETWYYCRILLTAAGANYYIDESAGARGTTNIKTSETAAPTTLHIGVSNRGGVVHVDNIRYGAI